MALQTSVWCTEMWDKVITVFNLELITETNLGKANPNSVNGHWVMAMNL
jgi:hypothetical protein